MAPRGEILSLQWSQVDLDHRIVRLEPGTTKNDEARIIPLVADVLLTLKQQKETAMHSTRTASGFSRAKVSRSVPSRQPGSARVCGRDWWTPVANRRSSSTIFAGPASGISSEPEFPKSSR